MFRESCNVIMKINQWVKRFCNGRGERSLDDLSEERPGHDAPLEDDGTDEKISGD